MKVVYVCSPLSGNIKGNMKKAADFCRFSMHVGVIPFAPHLLFTDFMDDTVAEERELAMKYNMEMLHRADELWAFTENGISSGMSAEIAEAQRTGMTIRYFHKSATSGESQRYLPVMSVENPPEDDSIEVTAFIEH